MKARDVTTSNQDLATSEGERVSERGLAIGDWQVCSVTRTNWADWAGRNASWRRNAGSRNERQSEVGVVACFEFFSFSLPSLYQN